MAEGLRAKVRNFFFEEQPEMDDFQDEPMRTFDVPEQEEPVNERRRGKVVSMNQQSNVTPMPSSAMKMILYRPMTYDETQTIVDNLRAHKPVIVSMVGLDKHIAQRILDFMAGAVYALNGTIRKVEHNIFVIVPSTMTLVGSGEEEEQ